jgi:hypothetical protein
VTWVLFLLATMVRVAVAADPARPHGALSSVETEGSLDKADVEPVVSQLGAPTAYCVGLVAGSVQSPVHYRMTVRNGRVGAIEDVTIGDLRAPDELAACLERKLGSWPFPGARGQTKLALGFTIAAVGQGPDAELGARPIEALTRELASDGRIYQPDPWIRAALDGSDPCEAAGHEFAIHRCTETKDALLVAARRQIVDGFVVAPVRAEMGAFDFEAHTFPVRIEPLLVSGGIGTPNAPSLTLGQLAARYRSTQSADYELSGGIPLLTHTVSMEMEAAEELVARTDRQLYGIALVRLRKAYDRELRTGEWETRASSPAKWAQDRQQGRARDADLTITWYAVDVEVVALELYDPATGGSVAGWLADGYDLKSDQGAVELVEPKTPEI